ncbi:tetraacyldisaccharide 4'-kinase [Desulfovibrio sp. JC010]|uniref:tetraacyldisaccharide 4'-kinase n=1 Tax=Desulfovibrio sp. JC010 TaxID=2593641 RepID=UPI0013D50197|nr:tetraacyldisaccharide 4'-kinase [Desulfovibrio sp. JC010]NDV27887.1 tetraacyldisaccharide 4'-kinase [Desulfovibrio sp. JC010]
MSLLFKTQKILSPILAPISKGYGVVMSRRAEKYSSGEYERFRPECPCISVGNIGSGGSGKTPLADWLLKWAQREGLLTALLTRGYGAKPAQLPYLVNRFSPVQEAGDEPLMLANSNPQAKIVVDPVRKRSGAWVTQEFKPGLMLLDDGFQHMAVERDLDFVLLTPDDFSIGWDKVIPRGTWRESVQALQRADVFFVKSGPDGFRRMNWLIREKLSGLGKPVFQFELKAKGLKLLSGEERLDFGSDKYLLFAGIGKPEILRKDAGKYMGRAPEQFMIFKDHHGYTAQDVEMIRKKAAAAGAKRIICTPKDAIKLTKLGCDDFYVIDLEVEFKEAIFFDDTEDAPFDKWWNKQRLIDAFKK